MDRKDRELIARELIKVAKDLITPSDKEALSLLEDIFNFLKRDRRFDVSNIKTDRFGWRFDVKSTDSSIVWDKGSRTVRYPSFEIVYNKNYTDTPFMSFDDHPDINIGNPSLYSLSDLKAKLKKLGL